MGRFADLLAERQRQKRLIDVAKRAAKKVAWPKNEDGSKYQGTVMWCPGCYEEIGRIPEGETMETSKQQEIADAHRAKCRRLKLRAV